MIQISLNFERKNKTENRPFLVSWSRETTAHAAVPFPAPTTSTKPQSPMIAAARDGFSGPRILLSLAVIALAIAIVSRSLGPTVPDMADDLPASIYDIAVKVGSCCLLTRGDLLSFFAPSAFPPGH